MDRNSQFHDDSDDPSNSELGASQAQDSALNALEARLQDMESRIQSLKVQSPLPWPTSREKLFDAALDLRVKLDAVRWMLRVSKHLSGQARERVILTITNSLTQLEKAVEPAIRAA